MQADRLRLRLINEENIVNMGTRGGGEQKRQKRRTLVRKRQINSVSAEEIQKEKHWPSRRLIKEKNKECVKLCKSGIRRLEVKQRWSVKKEKEKKNRDAQMKELHHWQGRRLKEFRGCSGGDSRCRTAPSLFKNFREQCLFLTLPHNRQSKTSVDAEMCESKTVQITTLEGCVLGFFFLPPTIPN